jgi:hypothetical protein
MPEVALPTVNFYSDDSGLSQTDATIADALLDQAALSSCSHTKLAPCENNRARVAERPSSAAAATAVTSSPGKAIPVAAVCCSVLFGALHPSTVKQPTNSGCDESGQD